MNGWSWVSLSRGYRAKISNADREQVLAFKWCVSTSRNHPVAMRSYRANGKTVVVLMHRFLLSAASGESVDHINGDSLDNRRENIRLCDHKSNRMNTRKPSNNTSGFKGVMRDSRSGLWIARICANRKTHHLGLFVSKEAAARAYDAAAIRLHGEFARLNFNAR